MSVNGRSHGPSSEGLTHGQTRQKFKEAYDIHFEATIERAEKQIILAKQARRILNLLDDTPIVPGDVHQPFGGFELARDILNDAEEQLRNWQSNVEPIHSTAGGLGLGAMPGAPAEVAQEPAGYRDKTARSRSTSGERRLARAESLGSHDGGGEVQPPYTEAERREVAQAGVI